jgi:N-acetylated-alpha-linked acidic dipeptidase
LLLLPVAGVAFACLREFHVEPRHTHRKPLQRRQEAWPPVLTGPETTLVNSFDNNTIDDWADYYGHQVKLAGLGREAAEWTRDKWASNGFNAALNEYQVFLSYPVHQALSVSYGNGTVKQVKIQEDALPEDDVTGRPDRIPTFHGYSASGNVTAEYVYVG